MTCQFVMGEQSGLIYLAFVTVSFSSRFPLMKDPSADQDLT